MASNPPSKVGFGFGLRQPAVAVTLKLQCPPVVDFDALDGWLKSAFDLDLEPMPTLPGLGVGVVQTVAGVAWRVLLLAREIRQAAGMPVFETGKILRIAPSPRDSGESQVLVAVPQVDGFPQRVLALTCEMAASVVSGVPIEARDPPGLEVLYQQIHDGLVKPMKALSGAGVSTLPLLRAAFQRGIPFRHLGGGVYFLGWGYRSRLLRSSAVGADSAIGSTCSTRKDLATNLLRAAGFPATEHFRVADERQALMAAESLGWPVVVKPADRERSEGVTVHVDTPEKLRKGFEFAIAFSQNVLVERQVPGVCIRLLVANARFLYAISRKPAAVVGDGVQTVEQMIYARASRIAKLPPWRRSKQIEADALTQSTLQIQGLAIDSVPKKDQIVSLREIESSEWGGEIEDVTPLVHPDNKDLAVRAAALFGLRNAGIDLITTGIDVPWHRNGAVLTEVNFSPYFGGNPTARARLPDFFAGFIEQDGRLPVEVFLGGQQALQPALDRQRELRAKGVPGYLTSHDLTLDDRGRSFPIVGRGSFDRTLSLLMNPDVKALIIVVQTDEWLHTGLPVDRFDKIHLCDGALATRATGELNGKVAKDRLLKLMNSYTALGDV